MTNNHQYRSICHASVGTNKLAAATVFYQTVLSTLGIELFCQYQHAAAFGKGYPEFWVQVPFDQQTATVGNGVHFGFVASSKQQVDAFYQTALRMGATDAGQPGARVDYGAPYYGCFVRDLDGHKIEASFWDFNMSNMHK